MKTTVAPYQTAAWCVRVVCTNGTTVRMTTYPFDLTMSNATVYETDSGYEQTAFVADTSMASSAIDVTGFVGGAGLTRDQIASGVLDNARIYIFKCNFLSPVEDYEPVLSGFFGKTTLEDGRYKVETMSLIDTLSQSVGKAYTAACSRTFGDAGCGIDLTTLDVVGAVTSVTSYSILVDSSRAEATDYFTGGTLQFTSGNNAGLKPQDIKAYTAGGTIETFDPWFYLPQIGDTFVLIPGCRKRLADCQAWSNVVNFFGFTNIPTASVYQQVGGNR